MPDPLRTRLLRALRNGPWVPLATLAAVLAALVCVHVVLDDDAPIVVHVDAPARATLEPLALPVQPSGVAADTRDLSSSTTP